MAATIKNEILSHIRANCRGVSTRDILDEIPLLDTPKVIAACNELLQEQLITIYTDKNRNIVYKATVVTAKSKVMKNAANEEKVVYQVIEASGNTGIWIRDIRQKSNLIQNQLNKVLKNLVNKKLIKEIKPATGPNKKLYMLYDLKPDVSLTGGNWYTDEGFDSDYVDALSTACMRFLDMRRENAKKLDGGPIVVNNNSYTSAAEVREFIIDSGLSKVNLSEEEIDQILMTLCYDDKVDRKLSIDGNHQYKAVESLLSPPGFVRTPCGTCPVFESCNTSSTINPRSCTYLKDWLV